MTGVSIDITKLRQTLDEVQRLREQLQQENIYLRDQIRIEGGHETIAGESEPVLKMLVQAEKVAPADSAVLITGETGTGKELLAQWIHDHSPRSGKAMVKVNCAALPATLVESELFGRERGAYTGALSRQIGRFELANGSTIFLDEIGQIPLETQAKLLRVLQEGQFERLGGPATIQTDARVIAATNRDLEKLMEEGRFLPDLYYRLCVFPIHVPPLRERREDVPLLIWHFVEQFANRMSKRIDSVPKRTMEALQSYPWPGNIRELQNVVERAMIITTSPVLQVDIPPATDSNRVDDLSLEAQQRRHILDVLRMTNWRIRGANGAAELLKIKPTTLEARMRKLGITRPK